MSAARWIAGCLMLAGLIGLLVWQQQRERLLAACSAQGGVWNGRLGVCETPPPSPILRRDLERS